MQTPSNIPGASAALIAALDARDRFLANNRDTEARDMMSRAFLKVPAHEARACAVAIIKSDTADSAECLAFTLCIDTIATLEGARRDDVLASLEAAA